MTYKIEIDVLVEADSFDQAHTTASIIAVDIQSSTRSDVIENVRIVEVEHVDE